MPTTSSILLLALSAVSTAAQASYGWKHGSPALPPFIGDPFKKYSLTANGINASFIPYGARLTNLFVKDKNGNFQDVALGYDDGQEYLRDTETNHTYFGAVVGRYANRIKNGTFTLANETFHIPTNEHAGADTLHGGFVGYDQQNWTVAAHTPSSITFTLYDDAQSGFPGAVLNVATYTLADDASWTSRLISIPLSHATPIMLANHVYWNLGAFVDAAAVTVRDNTLYMPYAKRIIDIDGIEVPTGLINTTFHTPYDFTRPGKTIGADLDQLVNSCGTGCTGYDNAFILDRPVHAAPADPGLEVLRLAAPSTGITMNVATNQQGLQIYTCDGQNGTIPVKRGQQHLPGRTTYVEKFGCVVIETQDWIDGINNPQWGREQWQIFTPTTEPAINIAKYTFSVTE